MPKIERRRSVVKLYQGDIQQQLSELRDKVAKAAEVEARTGLRMGQKSQARALAIEHDELQDKAEETAVPITVWALTRTEWNDLTDLHPKRDENERDAEFGRNMDTFPLALLHASLVGPNRLEDIDKIVAKGAKKLADIGELSHPQHSKLEKAAWEVNAVDDALPKLSLVSLLRSESDDDSKSPPDTE